MVSFSVRVAAGVCLLIGGARAFKRVGTSLHLQLQTSQDGSAEVNFLDATDYRSVPSCHPHLLQIDKVQRFDDLPMAFKLPFHSNFFQNNSNMR